MRRWGPGGGMRRGCGEQHQHGEEDGREEARAGGGEGCAGCLGFFPDQMGIFTDRWEWARRQERAADTAALNGRACSIGNSLWMRRTRRRMTAAAGPACPCQFRSRRRPHRGSRKARRSCRRIWACLRRSRRGVQQSRRARSNYLLAFSRLAPRTRTTTRRCRGWAQTGASFLVGPARLPGADLFPEARLATVALVTQAQCAVGRARSDGAI